MNENPLNNNFSLQNQQNVSPDFINKKNNMNRSNVIITFLLVGIIFLMLVIGYLIYSNVKANNSKPTTVVEKCDEIKTTDEKKEEVVYSVTTETLESLEKILPKINGTTYIDYNLFNTNGLNKADIDKLNTQYDFDNYLQVIYYIYRTDISEKRISLYMTVALYNDRNGQYAKSSDQPNSFINKEKLDIDDNESLKKYGTKFKLTYYYSTVGYYLESIEHIEEKKVD